MNDEIDSMILETLKAAMAKPLPPDEKEEIKQKIELLKSARD